MAIVFNVPADPIPGSFTTVSFVGPGRSGRLRARAKVAADSVTLLAVRLEAEGTPTASSQ